MPKKITTNPKAVEARERKEAKKFAEAEKKKQQEEEEYWRDDDKLVMKKQKRKEELEKKKADANEKKALKQALYEEEMGTQVKSTEKKLTRAEIEYNLEKQRIESEKARERERLLKEKSLTVDEKIEENVNRLQVDGLEARNIDEAIAVLSINQDTSSADLHPEKRMKAAYTAFEEANLPRLKAENPTFRLSQVKQLLKKAWLKSPDNPMNQPHKSLAKGK